ncbi:hypothetical protein PTTG_04018, partial [Puccinia triticina 1-1 BBBD Race 1]
MSATKKQKSKLASKGSRKTGANGVKRSPQRTASGSTGVTIVKKMLQKNNDALKKEIASLAEKHYGGQPAKPLQIDTVANLAKGRNTFLMAGTGFGKSRIPEIYFRLLPQNIKPVILVLNPLDALGENQVKEKKGKFTAINLTKLSFNKQVAEDIRNGIYNFRLALVVIDEAHMIYLWGIVESNGRRASVIFVRLEDIGIFWPCYGKIVVHLQCRNNAPLLLLSATCRPVAVDAILKNLKLTKDLIDMMHGELTRTEIRIIRINMSSSLKSNLDLLDVFPSRETTPDEDLLPTLIYSGTRARTLTVLQVLDMARGTPGGCYNPKNTLARRFHSCTGEKDKEACVEEYPNARFPIISSTMALGLGQNWKRVRCVIHMGRGDPANIAQMIGRCGRDGKDGLAILFVETTRKGGKNSPEGFGTSATQQSDDDRMDALAVTPVCLRVAFAMDNKYGYIPLSKDDPNYISEISREKAMHFKSCGCSNCCVESGRQLVRNLKHLTVHNFDSAMKDQVDFPTENSPNTKEKTTRRTNNATDNTSVLSSFKTHLVSSFRSFYEEKMGESARFCADDLFNEPEASTISSHFDEIKAETDLSQLIGGEVIEGQIEFLNDSIAKFKRDDLYQQHINIQWRLREEAEEKKRQKKREYAAKYRANKRL